MNHIAERRVLIINMIDRLSEIRYYITYTGPHKRLEWNGKLILKYQALIHTASK